MPEEQLESGFAKTIGEGKAEKSLAWLANFFDRISNLFTNKVVWAIIIFIVGIYLLSHFYGYTPEQINELSKLPKYKPIGPWFEGMQKGEGIWSILNWVGCTPPGIEKGNPCGLALVLHNEWPKEVFWAAITEEVKKTIAITPGELIGWNRGGKSIFFDLSGLLLLMIWLRFFSKGDNLLKNTQNWIFSWMRFSSRWEYNFIMAGVLIGFYFWLPIANVILFWPLRFFTGTWQVILLSLLNAGWIITLLKLTRWIFHDKEVDKKLAKLSEDQEARIGNLEKGMAAFIKVASAGGRTILKE